MFRLILASASPRRRELLAQAGFVFEVCPAHIPEEPLPGEDPVAYVTRLAREKAVAVFDSQGAREQGSQGAEGREQGPGTRDQKSRDQGAREQGSEGAEDRELGTEGQRDIGLVVLGADTTVTLDGAILEKPRDAEDAARMLRLLSGRTHRVITGVAVVSGGGALGFPPLRQEEVARMGHGGLLAVGRTGSGASELGPRVEVAAEVTAVRFLTLSEEEIAAYVATGEPMDKAGSYGIQGRAARWIPRIEGCYFNVVGLPLALVTGMLEMQGIGIASRDREQARHTTAS